MAVAVEEVAEAMYKMVEEVQGKKKLKPGDLIKACGEKFGEEADKKLCKLAIRNLVESGRCVYSYFGGSFLELPPKEGVEK